MVRPFVALVRTNYLSPFADKPLLGLIDLSKATELKDLVFVCEANPEWIIMALQTVTRDHRNLRCVTIVEAQALYTFSSRNPVSPNIVHGIGETAYRAWLDLDRFLCQFSETRSILLEVLYDAPDSTQMDEEEARSSMESLIPELIKRGLVELAEREDEWYDREW